jgi:hypothetical protein
MPHYAHCAYTYRYVFGRKYRVSRGLFRFCPADGFIMDYL